MSKDNRTIADMPWFKFFGGTYLPFVQVASTESAGLVFKAVCCYVCDKPDESPQLTDSLSQALFQSIKNDIDRSFESYLNQVKAGAKGGRPPKNPRKPTLTHPNPTKPKQTEEEVEEEVEVEKEGECKADKPPTRSKPQRKQYGQYGWVKLSQEEYIRLSNDLGENEVKRCITYLDESAQSNGNKNKWRDWNLVIRRCSRGRWGLNDNALPVEREPIQQKKYRTEVVNGEEVDILADE